MDQIAALLGFAFFGVLVAWVFYMIVKAAVRNGLLEADVARLRLERQQRAAELRAELERTGQL